jgi:membrane protease YdiL (CAAX protease family)
MDIQKQDRKKTIRNLTIFTFGVIAFGWLGRGLDVKLGNPATEGLGILLWISTPLLISSLLRLFAGDVWKDFGFKPNFKGNRRWYVIAFLAYPVATACILIIGNGLGMITIPDPSLSALGLFALAFAIAFLRDIIKNFFEEAAWRGYLAPKIYSLYIPLAIAMIIAWAFVYGEIRLATNSIWPAVLMHTVEDALLFTLVIDRYIQILPGTDWLISPMNGLVSAIFFLVIGVGLRQLRKRKSRLLNDVPMVVPA